MVAFAFGALICVAARGRGASRGLLQPSERDRQRAFEAVGAVGGGSGSRACATPFIPGPTGRAARVRTAGASAAPACAAPACAAASRCALVMSKGGLCAGEERAIATHAVARCFLRG